MPEQQQMMKRQQVLADFGDFAIRSDDLDEVLTEACRLVSQALGTHRAKVLEIQEGGSELLVRAGVGWGPDVVGKVRLPMSERSSETFSIREAKPVISRNMSREDRFDLPAFMKEAGVVALVNVPIFVPGPKPYGLLQVDAVEPRTFDQADTEFLRTYATILGPVIDRLHLVEERRATQGQLAADYAAMEELQGVSLALVGTQEPQTHYERILTAAVALMKADAASIQAFDAGTSQLELLAWRGFDSRSAAFWAKVRADTGTPCGRALSINERIVVPDMDYFGGEPEEVEAFQHSNLLSVQSTPLRAHTGQVVGMLSTHWHARHTPSKRDFRFFDVLARLAADVIERTQAGDRLRLNEERHRALIEGVPQLVWRAVEKGRWNWASPQWIAYTGQSASDSYGLGWLDMVHPDDRETAMMLWLAAEKVGFYEADHRVYHAPDQRYRWFQSRATAMRDEAGRITEWLGTCTDIDELRAMQERQHVMVAELQHRTRNLIAVVRSVAQQTLDTSDGLESFRDAFNERLGALSRVQGLLSRSDRERITINALLRTELEALGANEPTDRIKLSGPEVALRNSVVQTLALALHELATNARKYGALASTAGRLQVNWEVQQDARERRRLVVSWVESGVDKQQEALITTTKSCGYGRELIEEALPYALGAKTTYEIAADGVRCIIDLPLDKRHNQAI